MSKTHLSLNKEIIVKLIYLISFAFSISQSQAFEPVYKEARSYTNKVSRQFKRGNNPQFCRFETKFDEEKQEIKIKVGVVGSRVDYFGWNAPISIKEFPLKKGFKKIFKIPGVTGMLMTYDGKTLNFQKLKSEKVWNRLYPFSIEIDSKLLNPKRFRGRLEGFERTYFNRLKKHVSQTCLF